jgi:hypothetical protein
MPTVTIIAALFRPFLILFLPFVYAPLNEGKPSPKKSLCRIAHNKRCASGIFPFERTNEALAYVETGRAKGKVVAVK